MFYYQQGYLLQIYDKLLVCNSKDNLYHLYQCQTNIHNGQIDIDGMQESKLEITKYYNKILEDIENAFTSKWFNSYITNIFLHKLYIDKELIPP